MKILSKYLVLITILAGLSTSTAAQQVSISLGADKIAVNEYFTIKITVEDGRLQNYGQFPNIPGFEKQGTSSRSSTQIINGQVSSSQSIIQNYAPTKEGKFRLEPFSMKVNGQQVSSSGKTITVTPAQQRNPRYDQRKNPMDDFFDRDGKQEYVDVKEDAFFALTTSDSRVYVGEGFTMTLAFYVAESNRAPMQFHEPGQQLSDILKDLKPANCWEENFSIENIQGKTVNIKGKNYTQFKLYQAAYYPLNTDEINFPSVPLKMIKYKVAKNPSFFGSNRKEAFKTFYTQPKKVRVSELPPHPLRDMVAVGDYRLEEKISEEELKTGESFSYQFVINGEGNISAIEPPQLSENEYFDFYSPNVNQHINRHHGTVSGEKVFSFYAIPNEPGEYDLGNYFSWIFFNPKTARYDTLSSDYQVNVTGESKKNEYIMSNDLGAFYDVIDITDDDLQKINSGKWGNILVNIVILTMLALMAILIIRK